MFDAKTDTTGAQSLAMRIKPTPLERAMGRLMRAPDHDAGDGAADAGAADGGDAASSGDGDGDGKAASAADAGDGADGVDDATVLGSADAGDGAGDKSGDGAGDSAAATGDGKDDDSKDGANGLPEKYDINLTVKDAEGKDQKVELDPALIDEATPVFKELGLGNEQANKIVALVPQVQARMAQQQQDEFAAVKADWAKSAEQDPEIGGKNWKQSQQFAARALDAFGAEKGSDFRALLDDTGLGNHPEMIRMFRKIGEAVGEDGLFARGDAKPAKKSREEELYPEDVPTKK
jgi:hypothetical protein